MIITKSTPDIKKIPNLIREATLYATINTLTRYRMKGISCVDQQKNKTWKYKVVMEFSSKLQ
jgi:hypothetical protein